MKKVFLSYARSSDDVKRAWELCAALKNVGVNVWLDTAELHPGDNWYKDIGKALSSADAMIVLVTPASMKSEWVARELSYAMAKPRLADRLIPVFVGGKVPAETPWVLAQIPGASFKADADRTAQQIAELLGAGKAKARSRGRRRAGRSTPHRVSTAA